MTSNMTKVKAVETMEGGGVTVHRTIGTPSLRNYDPFLLLDQISSDNPDDYIAGFPSHPHRGFNTFTYMIDGDMQHKDSMGNTGNLGAGGAQWMKAGSGVIHSEMPKMENGLMRGFQLWINLPAQHKWDAPDYQEYTDDLFPVVYSDSATVKVLVGEYQGADSPISDDITQVTYLDVQVNPGEDFWPEVPMGSTGFVYLFEGDLTLNEIELSGKSLMTISEGESYTIKAGDNGARLLFVHGKPVGEPIVQYGPFVMNTREEVEQAMQDYRDNKLVKGADSVIL